MQVKLPILILLSWNFHFLDAMQREKPQLITTSKEDWERVAGIIEALDRAQPPTKDLSQLREEAFAREMHDEIVETMLIMSREECSGWGSCGIRSPVKSDTIKDKCAEADYAKKIKADPESKKN